VPVDSVARRVTSQKNTTTEYTLEQQRENLKAHLKSIQSQIKQAPRNSNNRKQLGLRCLEIQDELSKLKPPKRDLSNYIADIAKEELPAFLFEKIKRLAIQRHRADNE
jgi:hypothetical protein